MKTNLAFFFKTFLLGTLSSAVLCGILGKFLDIIEGGMSAHQIWPTWLLGIVLGLMFGALISAIIAIIMIITKKTNLMKSIILSAVISVLIVVIGFFLLIKL